MSNEELINRVFLENNISGVISLYDGKNLITLFDYRCHSDDSSRKYLAANTDLNIINYLLDRFGKDRIIELIEKYAKKS